MDALQTIAGRLTKHVGSTPGWLPLIVLGCSALSLAASRWPGALATLIDGSKEGIGPVLGLSLYALGDALDATRRDTAVLRRWETRIVGARIAEGRGNRTSPTRRELTIRAARG